MDIEFLIDRLERYILEECPKVLGARAVNDDELRNHLGQIRAAIPTLMEEARQVVNARDQIMESAQQEAARVVAAARAEAKQLSEDHAVVQEARRQAQTIIAKAKRDAERIQAEADEYVFDSLSRLQGELTRLLRVVDNGLLNLEAERERVAAARNPSTETEPQR